jgi:hypothetical protein
MRWSRIGKFAGSSYAANQRLDGGSVRYSVVPSKLPAMLQTKHYGLIPRSIVTALILLLIVASSFGQRDSRGTGRQIKFEPGRARSFRGLLRPYAHHMYRFHARAEQRIHVNLHVVSKKAEEQYDVVYWGSK